MIKNGNKNRNLEYEQHIIVLKRPRGWQLTIKDADSSI